MFASTLCIHRHIFMLVFIRVKKSFTYCHHSGILFCIHLYLYWWELCFLSYPVLLVSWVLFQFEDLPETFQVHWVFKLIWVLFSLLLFPGKDFISPFQSIILSDTVFIKQSCFFFILNFEYNIHLTPSLQYFCWEILWESNSFPTSLLPLIFDNLITLCLSVGLFMFSLLGSCELLESGCLLFILFFSQDM